MNLEEALKLLSGKEEGIREWNRRREEDEEIPDLSGAKLSGANLSGANLPWRSHDLLTELLRRAAEDDIDKLKVAGLILLNREWCWEEFIGLGDPLMGWALDALSKYVADGDDAPDCVRERMQ